MTKPTAIVVGVGAERGLGAALCRRFAYGGYHVLIAGRTAAKINKVAETIVSAGGSAEPTAMDAMRRVSPDHGTDTHRISPQVRITSADKRPIS